MLIKEKALYLCSIWILPNGTARIELAAKASLNKVDAKKALDAVLESISQALANEDKVQLIGFGTFAVVEKPERTGINPQTKEKITIAARKVVKFKPADTLGK